MKHGPRQHLELFPPSDSFLQPTSLSQKDFSKHLNNELASSDTFFYFYLSSLWLKKTALEKSICS